MFQLVILRICSRIQNFLTGIPNYPLPDEKTEDWLAEAWMQEGFRRYLNARERALERYLSRGIGIGGSDEKKPLRTQNYLIGYGQLQELSNLMQIAKNAYEAKAKRMREKISPTQ